MKVGISIFALLFLFASPVFAHSGRTNSEGCHNERATGGYHCHSGGSGRSSNGTIRPSIQASPVKNEDFYNRLLAKALNGRTEINHRYTFDGGQAEIRVDIETKKHVIEGGLDKRSSLDSVQQALFASTVTGKQPVVVIYDTDGREGRYEYRIKTAAEKAGIEFLNLRAKLLP
jgi:hypothetical protein